MQLTCLRKPQRSRVKLVFIHGSNQSKESFLPQLNAPEFSSFDLWSLDLPGHGDSPRLARYSMHQLADATTHFLNDSGISNAILVGHSLGGHVALACHTRGYTATGLVLLAVPPASKPIKMEQLFQNEPAMSLLYKNGMTPEEMQQLASAQYSKQTDISQEMGDLKRVCPVFREQLPLSFFEGEHIDEQDAMRALKIPTFIAIGQHDRFINNEHIFTHLPSGAIVKSYKAGHNIHRESAQEFNTDLRRFIDAISR